MIKTMCVCVSVCASMRVCVHTTPTHLLPVLLSEISMKSVSDIGWLELNSRMQGRSIGPCRQSCTRDPSGNLTEKETWDSIGGRDTSRSTGLHERGGEDNQRRNKIDIDMYKMHKSRNTRTHMHACTHTQGIYKNMETCIHC